MTFRLARFGWVALLGLSLVPPCGVGAQEGAIAPKPPDADRLLQQAVELQQAGDVLGAIAAYDAALKKALSSALW